MRSYCILRSSRTILWYQIADVANGRQAVISACLSRWIYEKLLLSINTQSTFFTCIDLDTPQDQVGNSCEDDTQFEANIHTIRTDQFSKRTCIIDLGRT